jgi:hypothetical protein
MRTRLRIAVALALLCVLAVDAKGQDGAVTPGENLIVDGVPAIPASLAETAGRYGSFRAALMADWSPVAREMLIATRFGDVPQLHVVKAPGGARQQVTFFVDALRTGRFHPHGGNYILFMKDSGGGEWFQLYRYDLKTGDVTLLTDGKSRNLQGPWASDGDHVAYMSTRRTGKDTDLWTMNPSDPKIDHLVTQLVGGGWEPQDWSPDDKRILLNEELSINESYLWLVETSTGEKTALTARDAKDKVFYGDAQFSKDGKGIYVVTDRDSEFQRLAYIDFATKQPKYLTTKIPWDVERFDLTHDGKRLAFVTNEDGVSVVHVMDTATERSSATEAADGRHRGDEMASEWTGFGIFADEFAQPQRLLFGERGKRDSGAMDGQRDRGENRRFSGSGTCPLEEFRRKNDFGISVQACGQVYWQASCARGYSRRAGGSVDAGFSGAHELLPERDGNRDHRAECARVDGLRKNVHAAG